MKNTSQNQSDSLSPDADKKQPGQQGQTDGKDLGGDLAGKQGQQQQQPNSTEPGQTSPDQDQKASSDRDNRR
ncbi:hypothetical protein JY426_03545 [Stenotrophomonas maltophilia]|uniref:hypothetical protein n=1 Tax=Gammaproteobacteria TaxID=1236 RepID=UPI0018D33A9C|nr:hypothetical protein [Klebsiella pneumoniae]MBH1489499.1 hypothetical protein [Stenotrophomonas maltophilia]MBN5070573.1 hypothetical protein [Stenotrophomonas maltophilia]